MDLAKIIDSYTTPRGTIPVMLVGCYYEILHTGFTEFQATAIAQSPIVPFPVWLGSLVAIALSVNQDAMMKLIFSALGVNVPARVKWCGELTYPVSVARPDGSINNRVRSIVTQSIRKMGMRR